MDTVRTLRSMNADIIIMRHSKAGTPGMIAKELKCPVINAGDGWHEHPTQCLLDLYTIEEAKGKIKGLKVVLVGDILHSRVAGSLLRGWKKMGVAEIRVCGPPTMIPKGIENAEKDVQQLLKVIQSRVKRLATAMEKTGKTASVALVQAEKTLKTIEGLTGEDSQVIYQLAQTLEQLSLAARSIRAWADYLERHPEALIRGKGGYKER